MDYFLTYLILQVDSIHRLLPIIGMLFGLCVIIGYITPVCAAEYDDDREIFKRRKKACKPIRIIGPIGLVLCFAFSMFVPTTKTAIGIVAIPTVLNSDTISKFADTPGKIVDLLNEKLDKELDKIKNYKKKI